MDFGTERVNVLAVGINAYTYLGNLYGPINDIDLLKDVLVNDDETATLTEDCFVQLKNPNSASLRNSITKWVRDRSALHDVLVFYFSGHALPLGNSDIGLCTSDTFIHPLSELPIPTSLISVREIVSTIVSVKADPIIILDTCYSGEAGDILRLVWDEIRKTVQAETGSTYALMSSSTALEVSMDDGENGIFSKALAKVCRKGNESVKQPFLSLHDLHGQIRQELEHSPYDMTPQLFIGATLPKFPFVQNVKYIPQTERFSPYLVEYLRALWNKGKPRLMTIEEIRKIRPGLYGNHNKLKLKPWGLVKNASRPKTRQLSEHGIKFMEGEIQVPQEIVKDNESGKWSNAEGTRMVSIENYPIQPQFDL